MAFDRKRRKTPLILQIDDSRLHLAVTKELVAYDLKCDIIQADNADEGIGLARKHQPDIILLDAIMEPKDGWNTARELKDDARTRGIPLIMQTAKDKVADMDKAYSIGVDDFLTKPPTTPKLLRKFIKFLGQEIFSELGVDVSEAFPKRSVAEPKAAPSRPAEAPPPAKREAPPPPPRPAEIPAPVPCDGCGTPLTWLPPYQRWYCYPCEKYPDIQQPPPAVTRTCDCGLEMSYIYEKTCWYCFICKKTAK